MHISDGLITIEVRASHVRYAKAIDQYRVAYRVWQKFGMLRKGPEFDGYVKAKNELRAAKRAYLHA